MSGKGKKNNPENLKIQKPKKKIKSNKMNNQIQSFQFSIVINLMKIRFYKNNLYK